MTDSTTGAVEPTKKRRRKVIIPIVILLVGLGAGGFFFMKSSDKGSDSASVSTTTVPGMTVILEPTTLNLTDGHVLKVGISLNIVDEPKNTHIAATVAAAKASGSPEGGLSLGGEESKAVDLVISSLGAKSYEALLKPESRESAKEELRNAIIAAYGGDVVQVYYTTFVMK